MKAIFLVECYYSRYGESEHIIEAACSTNEIALEKFNEVLEKDISNNVIPNDLVILGVITAVNTNDDVVKGKGYIKIDSPTHDLFYEMFITEMPLHQ